MKIQPPHADQVEQIAFFSAPSFAPHDTAHDMLVYLMEQPWADIKQANGQVIVSDLREGGGMGRVVAVYTPVAGTVRRGSTSMAPVEPGTVISLAERRRERELV